jgi:hypothetical protein
MENKDLIPITELSRVYQLDLVFFETLFEFDIIEFTIYEEVKLVPLTAIPKLEQIIRIHQELDVNIEGVDVILNLVQKIDQLESEIQNLRNRLDLYEG